MSTIVSGNFPSKDTADAAVRVLTESGIAADRVCSFRINPPGQHAAYPIGGDDYVSPGAEEGGNGALKGAAVGGAIGLTAGLAAMPLVGPAAVAGGVGIGAYVGSLAGALNNMGDEDGAQTGHQQDTGRAAGILVAVHTPDPADRAVAADILRQNGAREVEETDGTWADGEWLDFDPKLKPSSEARPASPQ